MVFVRDAITNGYAVMMNVEIRRQLELAFDAAWDAAAKALQDTGDHGLARRLAKERLCSMAESMDALNELPRTAYHLKVGPLFDAARSACMKSWKNHGPEASFERFWGEASSTIRSVLDAFVDRIRQKLCGGDPSPGSAIADSGESAADVDAGES